MKRLFIAVLIIMLCGGKTGGATEEYFTLAEIKEQATQGWHETYIDKYGRTRTVDIDIDVFGDETAPVIKACWGDPLEFDYDGIDPVSAIKEARKKRGGVSTYPYADVRGMKVDLDYKYAETYGNNLTLREMYAFFGEALQEQGFNQEYVWEQPYQFSILYSAHKKTGEVLVPALYSVYLWQKVHGLPILTHVAESFKEYISGPVISPTLRIQMRDSEEYLGVGTVLSIEEILADDIPLCSVKKVIEGTRKMREDGYIQQVRSLRFGYVIYSDPNAKWGTKQSAYEIDTWYLVPAWVMECYVADNPKLDKIPEDPNTREITIDAQTGKMMDYFDKTLYGRGDARYKGFISWEDVQ